MSHLILVEGTTDKAVVKGIAEKLGINVKIRIMRGDRPEKAIRLANAELTTEKYSKVIILKDQHEHPQNIIKQKLNKVTANIKHVKTYPFIVKKSIEAWILAGMGIANPENIDDPETYLDHILMKRGKRYIKIPKMVNELVKNIDLQKAQHQSHTLKQFTKVLKEC